jgi:DNA-binding MurR/RpiR family transcriptional regulator
MQNASDILTEIQRRAPHLSAGQSRIASFVLKAPDEAKEISLSELCKRCDTSEPVVFAFCSALGLEGYRAFKTRLTEDLGARRQRQLPVIPPGAVGSELLSETDTSTFLGGVARLYQDAITTTLASLNPTAFAKAVDLLAKAKRLVIIGVGVSGNIGFVAQQNFLRTGLPVTWTSDPNLNYTHIVPLMKGDVCLALSQMGNQRDTIEGLEFAHSRGVSCIAVTSDPESPLSDYADVVLLTAPSGVSTGAHLSIGAQLATPILMVADALAIALGARDREGMQERSQATARAMKVRTVGRKRG